MARMRLTVEYDTDSEDAEQELKDWQAGFVSMDDLLSLQGDKDLDCKLAIRVEVVRPSQDKLEEA